MPFRAVPCRAVPCSRAATQLPSAASLPDQGGQRDAVTPLQPRSRLPRESSPSALLRKKTPFLFTSVSLAIIVLQSMLPHSCPQASPMASSPLLPPPPPSEGGIKQKAVPLLSSDVWGPSPCFSCIP